MTVVVVKYRIPGIYEDEIVLCASMQVAVDSVRLTMCTHGDHRALLVKQTLDVMKPWLHHAYAEGDDEREMYAIAVIEDYTEQRVRKEVELILPIPEFTEEEIKEMDRVDRKFRRKARKQS